MDITQENANAAIGTQVSSGVIGKEAMTGGTFKLDADDQVFGPTATADEIIAAASTAASHVTEDRQYQALPESGLIAGRTTFVRTYSMADKPSAIAVFQIPSLAEYMETAEGQARLASVIAGDAMRKASALLNKIMSGDANISDFPLTVTDFCQTARSGLGGSGRKRFDRTHWKRIAATYSAALKKNASSRGIPLSINSETLELALSNAAYAQATYGAMVPAQSWVGMLDKLISMDGQVITDKQGKPLVDEDTGETLTCDASLYRNWKATRDNATMSTNVVDFDAITF